MPKNLREYGLGDSKRPIAPPKAEPLDPETKRRVIAEGGCPNCGCVEIMSITVIIDDPRITTGRGQGRYMGCPACPWASPMMLVSIPNAKEGLN